MRETIFINRYTVCIVFNIIVVIGIIILNIKRKNIKLLGISILFLFLLLGLSEVKFILKLIYTSIFNNKLINIANLMTSHDKVIFINNIDRIKTFNFPVMFVSNYPSCLIEYSLHTYFDSLLLIGTAPAKNLSFFIDQNKILPVDIHSKKSFDYVKKIIDENVLIKKNNVFSYVEKLERNVLYDISPLRSGIFTICNELKIPVVPVVIDKLIHHNGIILKQNFRIYVGQPHLIQNVKNFIKNLRLFYSKKLKNFAKNKFPYNNKGFFSL